MSPSGASRMLRLLGVLKEATGGIGAAPIALQQVRLSAHLSARAGLLLSLPCCHPSALHELARAWSLQENAKAFERTRTLYQALGMSTQAMVQALEQSPWRFSQPELAALVEVCGLRCLSSLLSSSLQPGSAVASQVRSDKSDLTPEVRQRLSRLCAPEGRAP